MEWLNYHHLLYFWTAAKEGGVSAAARALNLSQPTISGQIRALEESLELKLFNRVGRHLKLTDEGHVVFRYADEIFGLGRELVDALRGRATAGPRRLHVGISTVLPKLVVHRLLAPALRMEDPVRIICQEDHTDRLLAELAIHGLDLVLADSPVAGNVNVRAFNHFLGECGLTFFGVADLARKYKRGFPESLTDAPMLMPTEQTLIRRSLEHWMENHEIRPRIVAEFEDSALLKAFGEAGEGVFAAPSVVEEEVSKHYNVKVVGRTNEIRERFYAISVERRIKHPAVVAISESAKRNLFIDS